MRLARFVDLADFTREEGEILETSVFPSAAKVLEACSGEGFETALAKYQKVKAQ